MGKHQFDSVPYNPGPRQPIGTDGIATSSIRTGYWVERTKTFCECEKPKPRDGRVRFVMYEGKALECKVCGICRYAIKP